jgi:hypothetical protein
MPFPHDERECVERGVYRGSWHGTGSWDRTRHSLYSDTKHRTGQALPIFDAVPVC